jgi:hypothetical protein
VAVNCCVLPKVIEVFAGVTDIDTGAATVSVVEPLIGLVGSGLIIGRAGLTPVGGANGVIGTQVAVIVVLPPETLLTSPRALIVATPGADDPQATEVVRFCVLPLLK